jgi:hypothetical protein
MSEGRAIGAIGAAATALVLTVAAAPAHAQAEPSLPFRPGEELVYRASAGKFGRFGRATMRVEGPVQIRGEETYLLAFDFRGKVLFFGTTDTTRSWLDPWRMASLRYTKRERSPITSRNENVDVFPEERRWADANGTGGESPTDAPLDELSYLYYIRTLPLDEGAVYTAERHFDLARNPVRVTVVGRDTLRVHAGEYATIVVEMRVTDTRYGGDGVVRMYLTDDAERIPVRIESPMPVAGKVAGTQADARSHRGAEPQHEPDDSRVVT